MAVEDVVEPIACEDDRPIERDAGTFKLDGAAVAVVPSSVVLVQAPLASLNGVGPPA